MTLLSLRDSLNVFRFESFGMFESQTWQSNILKINFMIIIKILAQIINRN
jgi:hypothetical protein